MEEIIILYKKDILEQTEKLTKEFLSLKDLQEKANIDNVIRKGQIVAQLEIYNDLLKQAI